MKLLTKLSILSAVTISAFPPGPARPSVPEWNTKTIPIAIHAANYTGKYTDEAVAQLARYGMVTIEKWYTPCGSQRPAQAGPECDVEGKMYETFRAIRKINPSTINIIYLNSMFDFAFYTLHGKMQELEDKGKPAFLRDSRGKIVELCNDGNFYCNITTFDHTKDYVRDLWMETLRNATEIGAVSGVFADHGWGTNIGKPNPDGTCTLCNGKGDLRSCWNFTKDFSDKFNDAHRLLLNTSQEFLAGLPQGGPTINGPWGVWHTDSCDFDALRETAEDERLSVVEASKGGCLSSDSQKKGISCMAAFLSHVRKGMYFSCVDPEESREGRLPPFYEEYTKELGEPTGPTTQVSPGIWRRTFKAASGNLTVVTYNTTDKSGTIEWADGKAAGPPKIWPYPSEPIPGPTPGPQCGTVMPNTGIANFDVNVVDNVSDPAACCDLCVADKKCAKWSWHGEEKDKACHLHSEEGEVHEGPGGCFSGVVKRSM